MGIFRALQLAQSSLSDEWEIIMESEVEARLSTALNSSKAVWNYPINHGQPSDPSDEISNKMKKFLKESSSICV